MTWCEQVGREYKGSPGIHSFCMRQSVIGHNTISEVPYTGISYNWPLPQGSTFGPPHDGSTGIGYSRDNSVIGNDVSKFMSYLPPGNKQ